MDSPVFMIDQFSVRDFVTQSKVYAYIEGHTKVLIQGNMIYIFEVRSHPSSRIGRTYEGRERNRRWQA
jgi:hypothetical protein